MLATTVPGVAWAVTRPGSGAVDELAVAESESPSS